MKKIYFSILLLIIISCKQNQNNKTLEPWSKSQLLEPKLLSSNIKSEKDLPKIISIGPGVVIKNSIGIGECRYNENIEKLKSLISSYSKDDQIVLYCGCCPFKNCPNIRPAFTLMNELGFKNHKLLNIKNNIKADWIDMGYQTE
ncbi:MAG: rhodanese-like domain-containing protein [Flavobacteriaceae bacterium]|tara:strand:- start:270 stop:701 length:432 start_codon:yes stop_codon:yes gene_type:complete